MKVIRILVFLLVIFLISSKHSVAQESTLSSDLISLSTSSVAMSETENEYQLPYPGILPDSPLYSLKVFRDRVVDFLITDPLKKSEFYILTSDKHLNGGVYLIKKGKVDLAELTISKGENYFEKAISEIKEAKKIGLNTTDIERKLSSSFKAHKKYVSEIKKKVSTEKAVKFTSIEKKIADSEKDVLSIEPRIIK